jgi:hypothetical protein
LATSFAVLYAGEKKPAEFSGHSMSVTFSMGSCTFNETQWVEEGVKVGFLMNAGLSIWPCAAAC